VAICPNQIDQKAGLYGLRNLAQWVPAQRDEILKRRGICEDGFAQFDAWELLGTNAYFA